MLGNLTADRGLTRLIEHDGIAGVPGKAASSWVVLARLEETLDRLVHEGRWQEWRSKNSWEASQEALRVLAAFPDTVGSVHSQAVVFLALLGNLEAPWRRLKVRPDVGVWSDDYSNLLRVFDWQN